jgi:hypothetical protein
MIENLKGITLTNWYAVDSVLFADRDPQKIMTEQEYKNYLVAKGAALSNLFEIYTKLGYHPTKVFENGEAVEKYGIRRGRLAKERAVQILSKDKIADQLREEIEKTRLAEGVSTEDYAKYMLSKKIKSTALDIVMIESALAATNSKKKLSDWQGQIMIQSYKVLRDSLIKYTD